jgi:glycosyltransferase involved in cell wall biosynthesis
LDSGSHDAPQTNPRPAVARSDAKQNGKQDKSLETFVTASGGQANVLFIGKRFYTNRDTLEEAYGRIYQLPHTWASEGICTRLWLIDYHGRNSLNRSDGALAIHSTPIVSGSFAGEISKLLLTSNNISHVVASGDCYIGLLGYLAAKRLKASFIFDVYDKYDDFSGYKSPPGFKLFNFLLQRADQRLFASAALLKQLGVGQEKNILVPNGIDYARFHPRDIATCREELKLAGDGDSPMIGYFGGMEADRGVEDLIDAVSLLRNQGTAITLLLGGKSDGNINFNVPGVKYVGNVPYRDMPQMLGACDLLAVPYRRSALMDAGASNKIVEALACGRPIVATRTPNLIENFTQTAKSLEGRLAEPGEPSSIAQAIQAQLDDPVLGDTPRGWGWSEIALDTADQLGIKAE